VPQTTWAKNFLQGVRSQVQVDYKLWRDDRKSKLDDRNTALANRRDAWLTLRQKWAQLLRTPRQRKSPGQLYQEMLQIEKIKDATQKILEAVQKLAEERYQLQHRLYVEMLEKETSSLLDDLRSDDPLTRFLAVQAVGKRRLHLESTLIGLLGDAVPEVRQAARSALVRLSRGSDFGTARDAWRSWLLVQDPPAQADEPGS
jgi:hypothetical protein